MKGILVRTLSSLQLYMQSIGCVSAMLLSGGLSSLGQQKGKERSAQSLKTPLPVIKPFKKQLHSASEGAERRVAMPIHLAGLDPVSTKFLALCSQLYSTNLTFLPSAM